MSRLLELIDDSALWFAAVLIAGFLINGLIDWLGLDQYLGERK